jgi:hypothetical protein
MPISLPVVFYLCDNPELSFDDCLEEIVGSFRIYAKAQLGRYSPPLRSGSDPRTLIYHALYPFQDKVLGQYLPKLDAGRAKSVTCIWPWWEKQGIKLEYGPGLLYTLEQPPKGHAVRSRITLPGNFEYQYTFYRNDTVELRRIWFLQFLQEQAKKEMRELGREEQMDERADPPDNRECSPSKEYFASLREITDLDDWKEIDRKAKGDSVALRKSRSRAYARLRAAAAILRLREELDKTYLTILMKARDGERGSELDAYLRRRAKRAPKRKQE